MADAAREAAAFSLVPPDPPPRRLFMAAAILSGPDGPPVVSFLFWDLARLGGKTKPQGRKTAPVSSLSLQPAPVAAFRS